MIVVKRRVFAVVGWLSLFVGGLLFGVCCLPIVVYCLKFCVW